MQQYYRFCHLSRNTRPNRRPFPFVVYFFLSFATATKGDCMCIYATIIFEAETGVTYCNQ